MSSWIIAINLRIQSKCGKMRTRKIPNAHTFHVLFYGAINVSTTLKFFLKSHVMCDLFLSILSTINSNDDEIVQFLQSTYLWCHARGSLPHSTWRISTLAIVPLQKIKYLPKLLAVHLSHYSQTVNTNPLLFVLDIFWCVI